MPGEPIRLGPFVGGINQLSDTTALQDNELVDALNLELDLDGSYIGRPPFYDTAEAASGTGMALLGYYITAAHTRLIGYNSVGIWIFESGAWSSVAGTSTVIPSAMVQYNDLAYIIASPLSAGAGGYIDDGGNYNVVSAIKKGGSAVIHKERLFVVPGPDKTGVDNTLLYGSAPADFTTWPVAVYINKGDGQKLMDIVVYNDNLLLFKEDSTYVLAYDSDPTDAVTRKVNSSIGVAVPIRGESQAIPTYYMATAVSTLNDMYGFRDIIDATNVEAINCMIQTKNYDHGVPHRYKRLLWGGV